MPRYEYQCQKCEKIFEIDKKLQEKDPEKCEECEGLLKRIISKTGFILKGSGWYTTDYKINK